MWHACAPRLAEAGPVLALDLRGHGDSSWAPDEDYRTATHAADVVAVLDALELRTVHLVGLSWGGLVAATVAAATPERVERLVMIDVPPSFSVAPSALPERPGSFADQAAVTAWEATANAYADQLTVAVVAAGSVRPGPGGQLVRKHDPSFLRTWPFRAEDHWPAVQRVKAPTLVVRAIDSPVLAAHVAQQMVDTMADARLIEVGPSGHLVPLDAPGPLGAAIADFLA
jgi:pimeloyl-ACP methyl ester carboxylesterase